MGVGGRAAPRSLTPLPSSRLPARKNALPDETSQGADHHRDRERSQHLGEVQRDESVELFDRRGLWPEGLMKLGRDDAANEEPFPAMRPAQNGIAPATPRRITGGTGRGSVSAHQNASPIALATTDANNRGQLTSVSVPRAREAHRRATPRARQAR